MYFVMSEFCEAPQSSTAWYLVHCKSRKEHYAAYIINTCLGLDFFVPTCEIRSRGVVRNVPFFPSYFFVMMDLQKTPVSKINSSPGVLRLVEFGGEPQAVPESIISGIRERLQHIDMADLQKFHPGDVVRMKKNESWRDLEMIFLGSSSPNHRVYVLLELLGRLNKVEVNIEALEKCHEVQKRQHIRFTRGKGRKIKNAVS
ncbi:transcription termination/antitermination protein NusG [Ktedonobacter robiniae]|uniref:NusG-like N-terminal domain-containing protein n=1 Tax=Ktedonobacter robiniae TaxID=2778365 RepID=A0ABQ3V6D3_9CHLR|nr:transcription termination/antitermination NusG family protein [Ktedonobacter robiniae]GHO60147.1 hypothetical protein KSB_86220 [Ktedonobacter robiniae]